jgi:hypothetical protein
VGKGNAWEGELAHTTTIPRSANYC